MPTINARASVSAIWDRRRAERKRGDPPAMTRAEELAAIERFEAERGVTRITEIPRDEETQPQQAPPRPIPGWHP